MHIIKTNLWTLAGLLIVFQLPSINVSLNRFEQSTPPDFSLILSDTGTDLYRKDYQSGNPDFVQVVHLSKGATIHLLNGDLSDPGIGDGVYGGSNPSFVKQTLREVWDEYSAINSSAFCITNGEFFSTDANPTTFAFPLKVNGIVVSDGYGINEYPNQKLILELWEGQADIKPLTKETLYTSSAPNIISGLTEDANKGPQDLTGRTFIAIDDNNNDGKFETVLIFNSKTSKQTDAANILRDFGADKVMMLDGGGSTQLICKGENYVKSNRKIPQTIAVVSKIPPPLSATISKQPNWPILIEGENLHVKIEIKNTGSKTWESESYKLINRKNPWGTVKEISLQNDVRPGEFAELTWNTDEFQSWGVYTTEWNMTNGDEIFDDPVKFSVVVVPKELEEKRKELEEEIKRWREEQAENIEQLIREWILRKIERSLIDWCNSLVIVLPITIVAFAKKVRKKK